MKKRVYKTPLQRKEDEVRKRIATAFLGRGDEPYRYIAIRINKSTHFVKEYLQNGTQKPTYYHKKALYWGSILSNKLLTSKN